MSWLRRRLGLSSIDADALERAFDPIDLEVNSLQTRASRVLGRSPGSQTGGAIRLGRSGGGAVDWSRIVPCAGGKVP